MTDDTCVGPDTPGPEPEHYKMSTTQYLQKSFEISASVVALVDVVGSIPLAEAIRIIKSTMRGVSRGTASDGIRRAVNNLEIRAFRMPNGEWSIGRRKVTS